MLKLLRIAYGREAPFDPTHWHDWTVYAPFCRIGGRIRFAWADNHQRRIRPDGSVEYRELPMDEEEIESRCHW
jgi:hypothetical protein